MCYVKGQAEIGGVAHQWPVQFKIHATRGSLPLKLLGGPGNRGWRSQTPKMESNTTYHWGEKVNKMILNDIQLYSLHSIIIIWEVSLSNWWKQMETHNQTSSRAQRSWIETKDCRSQGGGGRIVGVITRKTTKSTYLGSQQLTETEPIIRQSTWFWARPSAYML